jgi:hypothetical protein
MEQFSVQLAGNIYVVEPQDNGTFRLLDGGEKIGVIYPEPCDAEIEWKTMDDLEGGFVSQIGELIHDHHM